MGKANKSDKHRVKSPLPAPVKRVIKTENMPLQGLSREIFWGYLGRCTFYKEKLSLLLEKPQRFRKSNQSYPLCLSDSLSLELVPSPLLKQPFSYTQERPLYDGLPSPTFTEENYMLGNSLRPDQCGGGKKWVTDVSFLSLLGSK